MCVYKNCFLNCKNKEEHRHIYARMRKSKTEEKEIKRSPKVNWDIAEKILCHPKIAIICNK